MIAGPGVIDQGPSSMIGKGKTQWSSFFIIGRGTFLMAAGRNPFGLFWSIDFDRSLRSRGMKEFHNLVLPYYCKYVGMYAQRPVGIGPPNCIADGPSRPRFRSRPSRLERHDRPSFSRYTPVSSYSRIVECTPDAVFLIVPEAAMDLLLVLFQNTISWTETKTENVDAFITTRRWQSMTQPEVFARDTPATLVLGRSAFRIRRRFVSSKSERHAAENKYIAIAPLVGSGKILPAAQVVEERKRANNNNNSRSNEVERVDLIVESQWQIMPPEHKEASW
jgi:hypothetical protein